MSAGVREEGAWQVRVQAAEGEAIPAIGDASWSPFKARTGSDIVKTPVFEPIDPIRTSNSPFDTEIVGADVVGDLPLYFEGAETPTVKTEIDSFFEAAFGSVLATAQQTALTIEDTTHIEVGVASGASDDNLKVGDGISLQITRATVAIWTAHVVTEISLGTGASGGDLLTIVPALLAGDTLTVTTTEGGRHFRPDSAVQKFLMLQKYEPTPDDVFTYKDVNVTSFALTLTPRATAQLTVSLKGREVEKNASPGGTVTVPGLDSTFIMKGAVVLLGGVATEWNSNFNFTYGLNTTDKLGIEAADGIAGVTQGERQPTIQMNYQYNSSQEMEDFEAAVSKAVVIIGQVELKSTPGEFRFFSIYAPNVKFTQQTRPVDNKLRKYDQTGTCYQVSGSAGDDECSLSIF